MKNSWTVFIILLFVACSSVRPGGYNLENPVVTSRCPDNSTCTFEIIKDKSLKIITDVNGRSYYQLTDAPGKNVAKYTFARATPAGTQDGSYSEEIVFESDDTFSNIKYGKAPAKKLFGVHCFCRGKAGYYAIDKATFSYTGNVLTVTLPPAIIDNQQLNSVKISFK